MDAIIHPGMHKTGTSSIQATLVKVRPEGLIVTDVASGNMSGVMALLFLDQPREHHSLKSRGLSIEKVQDMRAARFERLDLQTRQGAEKGERAIFTAEFICNAPRNAVERLAQFYRERGYHPRVVAYVRAPVSYMQSAFQQRLKGELNSFSQLHALWPNYMHRFQKLDDVFGRENVTLRFFHPAHLKDGDVCLDFFSEIGASVTSEEVVRKNASLSLEASALLFVQRNLGEGFVRGFDEAPAKNQAFIKALSRIGHGKIRFQRSLVEKIYEQNRQDLDWMEDRLGHAILDLPVDDAPDAIGCVEDLFRIADQHRDALEDLLMAEIRKDGPLERDRLIRNLELLRKLHY